MKRFGKMIFAAGMTAVLVLSAQTAFAEEDPAGGYEDVQYDVPFVDDGEDFHTLDLFGCQTAEKAMPTVIEVHGGGFIGGNKDSNIMHCVGYAENGFAVASIDYCTVPKEGTFKDAVQDLFAAYNWVAETAEENHFDLNNVFLSGDSAGGYYVLLSDAIWHSEELQEYFGVTLPSFTPSGYALTAPETRLAQMKEDIGKGGVAGHVAETIGEEILTDEDLMSHMDLYSAVDPQVFAGIYMITSTEDTTTGESTLKFDEYLTENNVEHTLINYESEGNRLIHVFNISNTEYPESQKANQGLADYMLGLIK